MRPNSVKLARTTAKPPALNAYDGDETTEGIPLTTTLKRRLAALESRFTVVTDESGFPPHSQEWLQFWFERVVWQYAHPDERGPTIPLKAFQAVMAEARRILAQDQGSGSPKEAE